MEFLSDCYNVSLNWNAGDPKCRVGLEREARISHVIFDVCPFDSGSRLPPHLPGF